MSDNPEVSDSPLVTTSQVSEAPVYQNPQKNAGKLEKLLVMFKLRSPQKPLIEAKPGISPESEGRIKINRDELQKKLQSEPSAS